jgi:hypothetical protein
MCNSHCHDELRHSTSDTGNRSYYESQYVHRSLDAAVAVVYTMHVQAEVKHVHGRHITHGWCVLEMHCASHFSPTMLVSSPRPHCTMKCFLRYILQYHSSAARHLRSALLSACRVRCHRQTYLLSSQRTTVTFAAPPSSPPYPATAAAAAARTAAAAAPPPLPSPRSRCRKTSTATTHAHSIRA